MNVKVVPEEKTFGYKGAVTREAWKKANIVFVGDYVEAACHAYKHGLIQVRLLCVVRYYSGRVGSCVFVVLIPQ